jgi:hypothetical protein
MSERVERSAQTLVLIAVLDHVAVRYTRIFGVVVSPCIGFDHVRLEVGYNRHVALILLTRALAR